MMGAPTFSLEPVAEVYHVVLVNYREFDGLLDSMKGINNSNRLTCRPVRVQESDGEGSS